MSATKKWIGICNQLFKIAKSINEADKQEKKYEEKR